MYITPNNFLSIGSAYPLREFLHRNKLISNIINFGENKVFSPVMTYNVIIELNKQNKTGFKYYKVPKVNLKEIKTLLNNKLKWIDINYESLNNDAWKLTSKQVTSNLEKIENIGVRIKDRIRTGIATLRDKIYIVEGSKEEGFYKIVNGIKYEIEKEVLSPLYKVSRIKTEKDIEKYRSFIIFPYKLSEGKYKVITEIMFVTNYPNAYKYLLTQKDILIERDKGKNKYKEWFEYGRSQGLNNRGLKLLHPTFSNVPKFMLLPDKNALYNNGYSINCKDGEEQWIQKVLNSKIMKYYIDHTSYPISGGYMCYQKKYIQDFSIPNFTKEEKDYLIAEKNKEGIDEFLQKKYNLVF